MAEIETPRGPSHPPSRTGEEATAGSLAATAGSACGGICSCMFGLVFITFLFFPYGFLTGLGFLGLLLLFVGFYLLYWSCQYAQRHNRPV